MALKLNLKTGHASLQFHVFFDDDFETADSLGRGVEPSRWKWLAEHRREFHPNDNDTIIDNNKMWTITELEISILFEVLQDNQASSTSSIDTTMNKNYIVSQDATIET